MGLKISPSAFSRAMTIAMSGLNYDSCLVYLDDLIVFGKNLVDHSQNLVKVLERLKKVNLKLNPAKCDFFRKELLYLGHLISAEGVSPDPAKISAVKNFPIPNDAQAVKRFVAFANYYRSFIPNFAHIASPLNKLSKKNVEFKWTTECQEAFDLLKAELTDSPILQYPNFSELDNFILKTDASGVAIGAVLCNYDDKPVAYASRTLNKAEKNYSTIEKELLGIVWAVKHFRPYLFGRKFIIQSDHRPLVYLFGMTNPSSRLTKFRLALEEYDFVVKYIRGSTNVVADALSRVEMTVDDLRAMTNSIDETINVITRSRSKQLKLDEQTSEKSKTKHYSTGTDHPGIVEVLKKPDNVTELRPVEKKEFNALMRNIEIKTSKDEFLYDDKMKIIYYKMTEPCSTSQLRASLKDCQILCTEYNINELLVYKNDRTAVVIKEIKLMYNNIFKRNGIKITILKDVQTIDDLTVREIILNDFHILHTGGHAGIKRMYNNIINGQV